MACLPLRINLCCPLEKVRKEKIASTEEEREKQRRMSEKVNDRSKTEEKILTCSLSPTATSTADTFSFRNYKKQSKKKDL